MFTSKEEYAGQIVVRLLTTVSNGAYIKLINHVARIRDPELEELIDSGLTRATTAENKKLVETIQEDIAEEREMVEVGDLLHTPTCFCSLA